MKEIKRKYRFYDFFMGVWNYCEGKDKYDAVNNKYGKEQARFILKTFKVERVYS